jgi:enediyne polyketide synthase
MNEGIAIVGMACRYPDAKAPAELWENVLARRRAFRRIPAERLRLEDYLTADRSLPDGLYATEAAVLEGYEFDRVRFRVVGSTYRAADLTHWLALDVATQALADSGFPEGEGLPREATGVLLGNSLTGEFSRANLMRLRWPYVRRVLAAGLAGEGWEEEQIASFLARLEESYKAPFPPTGDESLAGGLSNTIAGRICNYFDLHGGGYTLDGACSSSLLAVANACSALAAGDLDAALAGGVDLSIDPFELVGFARTGALAEDDMRVYDARSAGFIPGEGCGFVVLMRESEARRRGCRVYAVIRGWGISSDGHGGISRPESEGQKLALARAYRRAGFGIDSVAYFEGHGTGTAVGDAAELAALSSARREADPGAPRVPVGSIKANIGHTKAAAGIAGLLKATLAVHAQVLPPNTGCVEPHPEILAPGSTLRVLAGAEPWPADQALRAAVSAMGFGGINTHLVLEGDAAARRRALPGRERALDASYQDAELFLFAAPNAATLTAQLERLHAASLRLSRAELGDLAAELHRRLDRGGRVRAAIVAGRPGELAERLERLLGWLREAEPAEGIRLLDLKHGVALGIGAVRCRIGLLFPGQGSPSHLAAGLLRRRFESLEPIYELGALDPEADPVDTAVAQPAILTHSLAALALLDQLGLRAGVALGHSLGEIAALHWGGAFDAATALELARIRGRAMADLAPGTGERGAMASIGADAETVAALLREGGAWPEGRAGIAAYNSPRRTVVSGAAATVEAVVERARERGFETTRLRVSHAFHSPLVAAAAEPLARALAGLPLRPLVRPVASTVDGRLLAPDADLRDLLCRQVTQPVRYTEALAAVRDEVDLWLEVGPGRALTDLSAEIFDHPVIPLDAGGTSLAGLLRAAGAAFAAGLPLHTETLFAGRFTRPFDPDRPLKFLANPCEAAPIAPLARAPAALARAPLTPWPPLPVGEGERLRVGEGERLHPTGVGDYVPASSPLSRGGGEEAGRGGQGVRVPGQGVRAPLEILRALVAERAELPVAAVRDDSRLLSDLHLNSISVGQLVAEAARRLGARPPASPTDFAQATVAEIAAALALLAAAEREAPAAIEEEAAPAGVDSWVRPFTVDLVARHLSPRDLRRGPTTPGDAADWTIVAPAGHPLAEALATALAERAIGRGGGGVALCLPAEVDEESAGLFVAAARALFATGRAPGSNRFLLVHSGGIGGGFARTLFLERPSLTVATMGVPFGDRCDPRAADWAAAEMAAASGYSESWYDEEGTRRVPVLRLLPDADSASAAGTTADPMALPLTATDVLLVTGGGKGIAAECALDLARATGARLALLGRSHPERDAELAGNLERMRAAGLAVAYAAADVTDAAAVREALTVLRAELGPITALLHSAGSNTPCLVSALDEAGFRRTWAPKVRGLANVLAALDPERLQLLVTFGSIIGRTGLKGEADYAVANEGLARATERFAAGHPACRCLCLEWSVWAGVGMGERLGTLEALIRQGIAPIPPERGVSLLRELLARPAPASTGGEASAVSIVVAGRFGEPPTLEVERPDLPLLRYLERPRVYFPGVELVVDSEVSADTDPHLADHVFHGEPLFAAVLGMEAMAQAAMALTGETAAPVFEDAVFLRPVAVPPGRTTTIRVAALVREPPRQSGRDSRRETGRRVEVVLRDSSTGFAADHFRAVCRFGETVDPTPTLAPSLGNVPAMDAKAAAGRRLPLEPEADLYGDVLFHRGRFQRVSGYRRLRATECLADISPDGTAGWFGSYLPGRLVLGDPGARDAAIHAIQACIPHATLLPTGVDRLETIGVETDLPMVLAARERSRNGNDFVYDLELLGADGRLRERWTGLRLRAVDRIAPPATWISPLFGPYVERRLQEILPGSGVRVAFLPAGAGRGASGRRDSGPALEELLGAAFVRRAPDGRPETATGEQVSVAHAGELVLAVSRARSAGRIGCDLEAVAARSSESWRDLLGAERHRLAELIARERGESADCAATRVWAATESLKKAGAPHGAPLTLDATSDDGWLTFRSGDLRIGTFVGPLRDLAGSAALAVLVETVH